MPLFKTQLKRRRSKIAWNASQQKEEKKVNSQRLKPETTILLIMERKMLSDGLIAQARATTNFNMIAEDIYPMAVITATVNTPEIVVVEIPESGEWHSAEKCLEICDMIHRDLPRCKQIILCDEKDTVSCQAAIKAKQKYRIDDFLFCTNSTKYLFSKLELFIAPSSVAV